jgi:hypothetical protein
MGWKAGVAPSVPASRGPVRQLNVYPQIRHLLPRPQQVQPTAPIPFHHPRTLKAASVRLSSESAAL